MPYTKPSDERQCHATSQRSHERCREWAMRGKQVCYYHGGKNLTGTALPQTRRGKYSKELPAELLERYHEAINDPDLLSMRNEIGLLDTRLSQLIKRVGNGESAKAWDGINEAFGALQVAIRLNDAQLLQKSLIQLERLVVRGGSDYAAWHDIDQLLDSRRRLVESEQKYLISQNQVITSEQAMVFVRALTTAVKEHVTDPGVLDAIQREFVRLTAIPDRNQLIPSDSSSASS